MKRSLMSCTSFVFAALVLAAPAWAAKVQVCHVPPGNPTNFHTITINDNALPAHLAHGDLAGACSAHCSQLCDDGDACTIDACDASERCVVSHPPVNCDDGNACTTDTCDAATGCSSSAPRLCLDSSPCTVDSCDSMSGQCVFAAVFCSAGQTCNEANGNCEGGDVDECETNPCVRGLCTDLPNGYLCSCPPGWTGTNCELDVNECLSNPCQNGGVCTNLQPGYTCACANGFEGENCEGLKPVDWYSY